MSKLSRNLMNILTISSLMSMDFSIDRKKYLKPQEPKKIGYAHKENTPEEKRVKYLHKLKIKERRKRKGFRKGGRI